MQLKLSRRVSRDTSALPDDIRSLKKSLNRLGIYYPDSESGITRIADGDMMDALRAFQQKQNLKVDGIAMPDGETVEAINKALSQQSGVKLQWHCTDDKNSCAACIAHDGTIVDSDGEDTPGCLGKCRCWVTPVIDSTQIYDPPIEPVYPEVVILPFAGRIGVAISDGINLLKVINRPKIKIETVKLQRKFKHAIDFGVEGNPNKQKLQEYEDALQEHVRSPSTKVKSGTYHNKKAVHYFNPKSKLNVMLTKENEYIGGWKLSDRQFRHIIKR
jgi:peptidoglycan hydrolase-like protein with peptidoglycan-binding domain